MPNHGGNEDLTRLLQAAGAGDQGALEELTPLIYQDLKRLARSHMRGESGERTVNTTGLVHEAFLRLVGDGAGPYHSRRHFYAVASTVMRRILVSWARKRKAQKRGGNAIVIPLAEGLVSEQPADPALILAIDDCLERLTVMSDRAGKVVECRFFAGLSVEETSEALGVSESTVKREWRAARSWLRRELGAERGS